MSHLITVAAVKKLVPVGRVAEEACDRKTISNFPGSEQDNFKADLKASDACQHISNDSTSHKSVKKTESHPPGL